jgi:hypothetical protein
MEKTIMIKNVILAIAAALMIQPAQAQFTQLSKVYHAGPQACGAKATTTAFSPAVAIVPLGSATGVVLQITTNTTAGTVDIGCNITPPGQQLFSSKGVQVTAVAFYYGIQTTAMSSIATAVLATDTYPASTAAGAAAAGTVAALTLGTVTPTSLQLTTTSSGACFNEKIPLATPLIMAVDNQQLFFDQVFTTAGSTATTIQVCDIVVYYNEIVA